MSQIKVRETEWRCDLCGQKEKTDDGGLPEYWLRIRGGDVCDRCVSEVLTKKNAYCE